MRRRGCICPTPDWYECPACEAAIERAEYERDYPEHGHPHDVW